MCVCVCVCVCVSVCLCLCSVGSAAATVTRMTDALPAGTGNYIKSVGAVITLLQMALECLVAITFNWSFTVRSHGPRPQEKVKFR